MTHAATVHAHRLGWCLTCVVPVYDCVALAAVGPDGKGPYGKASKGDGAPKAAADDRVEINDYADGLDEGGMWFPAPPFAYGRAGRREEEEERIGMGLTAPLALLGDDDLFVTAVTVDPRVELADDEKGPYGKPPHAGAGARPVAITPGLAAHKGMELVPIAALRPYRGEDRRTEPKSDMNITEPTQTLLPRLTEEFRRGEAMQEPLVLGVDAVHERSLLVDGNTRLAAAEDAGFTHVPLVISRQNLHGWGVSTPHFRKEPAGTRKNWLLPSDIGLPVLAHPAVPTDLHTHRLGWCLTCRTPSFDCRDAGPDGKGPYGKTPKGRFGAAGDHATLKKVTAPYIDNLPGDAPGYVVAYASDFGSAYAVNEFLRTGNAVNGDVAGLKMFARSLEKTIAGAPKLPAPLDVYRGLGSWGSELLTKPPGTKIRLKAFQSTSIDPAIARGFVRKGGVILRIKAKAGLYVSALGFQSKARELLLQRGRTYVMRGTSTVKINGKPVPVVELDQQ